MPELADRSRNSRNLTLTIDRRILQDYLAASSREWLETNGIGGYASGTLAGANTRRYHGLLVAAWRPPSDRRVVLSKLEETLDLEGDAAELAVNQYPGTLHPTGYRYLSGYSHYPAPSWTYDLLRGTLTKCIFMPQGANTVYVRYAWAGMGEPLLTLAPLICWKDYHSEMHRCADGHFPAEAAGDRLLVRIAGGEAVLRMELPNCEWRLAGYWHERIEHERERERGLDWHEDLYCPAEARIRLLPGRSVTFSASLEPQAADPEHAWRERTARYARLVRTSPLPHAFARKLAVAADAYVVDARARSGIRSTIIAGYPWFTDWGRDTMIALPGICLVTGRYRIAREILRSFASHVSQGMIPNRFPEMGEEPEYNTVDATLWMFDAVRHYWRAAPDGGEVLRELLPVLEEIIEWHFKGTRYGIRVDPSDGLLWAGQPGTQLTWMDARVGDWVVTPRVGKPVEVNALWYRALDLLAAAPFLKPARRAAYARQARRARESFRALFVRPDGLGLYDCIGEHGPDGTIRPNQIIAAATEGLLTKPQAARVVSVVSRHLLTPYGLRTLAPSDPAYQGTYGGDQRSRDGAYHQGTVWPWLIGAFIEAHLRVHGDKERARSLLAAFEEHLEEAGIGHISEIFSGSAPHRADGCIAQAWSVAEVLRALVLTAC